MNKIKSIEEAVALINNGMSIMIGGFMATGSTHKLIDALVEKGVKDLTLICNDTAWPEVGVGKLVTKKMVSKIITSHIGLNPEAGRQMNEGETIIELVPQGTLAERIRCGGSGLGGFYTPTGVGTIVEEGKEKKVIDGKEYILEMPLRADIALINGYKVDKKGNVVYLNSARNFNPIMATAADIVIVEAENLLEVGEIEPNDVNTPSIFVDVIVEGGK